MKKKVKGIVLAAAMGVILTSNMVSAFAGAQTLDYTTSTSGSGNKITVKQVQLDLDDDSYSNEIELDFGTRVTFRSNAKIASIKDDKGVSYTGTITDKDSDECDIYVKGLKTGRTYTIKISGIKKAGTSAYRTLTVKVTVPTATSATSLKVKEVACDWNDDDDNEKDSVSFEFNKNVSFKSGAYIIIKDSAGKQITTKTSYLDKDSDEVEVEVNASLKEGKKYTYSIVGVRLRGTSSYKTITGSFTAYED